MANGENPKECQGQTKAPLHLIPPVALVAESIALLDGARKYGAYNWRETRVRATTYVSAIQRHLLAWLDGEEEAQDSGLHHLAHVRACTAILLDALYSDKLIDDRPIAGPAPEVLDEVRQVIAEMHILP